MITKPYVIHATESVELQDIIDALREAGFRLAVQGETMIVHRPQLSMTSDELELPAFWRRDNNQGIS